MESQSHPLLQQLSLQDAESKQLLWHCPLTQEQVVELVPELLKRLDCLIGERQDGADRLFWAVTFEDASLELHFEALCDSLWLQGSSDEIAFLRRLAKELL